MTTVTDTDADNLLLRVLLDPEVRADPYPSYDLLRDRAPRLRSALGPVVLSRYDDAVAALKDPRLGRGVISRQAGDLGGVMADSRRRAEFFERSRHQMLLADPPDHTRLRRLASRAFTPRRVEALRPAVQAMVAALVDRMAEEGRVDVMEVLALPLPIAVIGRLLGVPEADWASFRPLVRAVAQGIEPTVSDAQVDAAIAGMDQLGGYFGALLAERRADPRDDLLSALAQAREHDDALTDDEVVSTAILLFAAGFETTMNLIGNGLLALLRHPDQAARWRDDPALAPTGVEELLRWDSPVQINMRTALGPVDAFGERFAAGTRFLILQGSANRDPDRFDRPDRFDVARADNAPISFGWGIHHCLGAALARMEADVVFTTLLTRVRSVELAIDEPEWRATVTLRGLAALPVAVSR